MATAVGVDVGGTHLRVVAQAAGGPRSRVHDVPVPRDADALTAEIVRLSRAAAGDAAAGEVTTLAVGLPGRTGDAVPRWVPNLPFLDGFPLAEVLADRLGGGCVLLNDAQATAVAELREGALRGRSSALLVALGTGIGGAVVLGGRLVRGERGCAGAFGWLPADRGETGGGETGGGGAGGGGAGGVHGPWEQVASGAALERAGRPWGGAAGLVAAARAGDDGALVTIDAFGELLGRGTAALASMFDPEVIVVAGGLSDALDLLRAPTLRAHVRHASPAGQEVPLVRATLGPGAGVVGALHVALAPEVLL
ncbi:ROK family protein [Georgenia yuyongxinii]